MCFEPCRSQGFSRWVPGRAPGNPGAGVAGSEECECSVDAGPGPSRSPKYPLLEFVLLPFQRGGCLFSSLGGYSSMFSPRKVFSSLPKWLLTILLLGRSCGGGAPCLPAMRSPWGAIAVRSTVLLWKPHWSSHSPEPALQVPLGPGSGPTPSPHPPGVAGTVGRRWGDRGEVVGVSCLGPWPR